MYKYLLIVLLLVAGCTHKKIVAAQHIGQAFKCQNFNNIQELNKNQNYYIKRKIPVKIKGYIKYQDMILGEWAFLDTVDGLIFIDFSSVSPNINLPKNRLLGELIVEGYLKQDDTALNGFMVLPYGYEIVSKNIN